MNDNSDAVEPQLALPPAPVEDVEVPWLDDPSYDVGGFLLGLQESGWVRLDALPG